MKTMLLGAALATGLSFSAAQAADIVDTAVSAGTFTTLVQAVQAAELVDTLKGEGPFTVFAPTDEAFAAVPADILTQLLEPANKDRLVQILTYHVVPGRVMAADAANKVVELTTVEGQDLTVEGTATAITVNGVKVITADVVADNGVIHVIDTVLMP